MKSLFVNIQHRGEPASERSNPDEVMKVSTWPDKARPRSATIVITRADGGDRGLTFCAQSMQTTKGPRGPFADVKLV